MLFLLVCLVRKELHLVLFSEEPTVLSRAMLKYAILIRQRNAQRILASSFRCLQSFAGTYRGNMCLSTLILHISKSFFILLVYPSLFLVLTFSKMCAARTTHNYVTGNDQHLWLLSWPASKASWTEAFSRRSCCVPLIVAWGKTAF